MIFGFRTWAVLVFRLMIMVVFMLLLDPLLTLVSLAVLPLLFFTIHRLTGRIQRTSQESREHMSRLTSHIEQTMGAIRAVQVFGREGMEQQRFEDTSLNFVHAQLKFRLSEQVLNVATVAITGLGTAVVLFVAAERVIDGALTVGSLWVFVSYMQALYQMMNEIMFVYGPFQDAVVGVGRAFQVLDRRPTSRNRRTRSASRRSTSRSASVTSVCTTTADARSLRGVGLRSAEGEKVAIVGETGSGKTTILNLIPRLYDATEGAVEIDGVDVRELKLVVAARPRQHGAAGAAAVLRDRPREHPLRPAGCRPTDEVEAAATAARAHDFVQELPAKYETEVGERGVKLSIGQQQRISIARAFLKDAPILLLDEPTSALDLRTEADFLDGLDDLMAGRTVLIVAHRLSTIRNVDRIYFLEAGRYRRAGTHEELMQQRGRYFELFMKQFGSAGEPATV